MKALYDQIGANYAGTRRTDPRIAAQIESKLAGATTILNIGAGAGSYEPENVDLIAVEPSAKMIAQRRADAYPVVRAAAEQLPFEDNRFSHVMTVLSMHHWTNRPQAFAEINRVATDRFVAVTWNPASEAFWLTRDYFPSIIEEDQQIFPDLAEFSAHFDDVEVSPLMIPHDCEDGFLAAFWKRPEAYLNQKVRDSISAFAKMKDASEGVERLRRDLSDGTWQKRNQAILNDSTLDAGYVIVSGRTIGG